MMLKAPFPYFGGKSKVASVVWKLLGQPKHYLEPFFGSGAVLLGRPDYHQGMVETVNDNGNWQDDLGSCGIFFDPPYSEIANRRKNIYTHDSESVAHDVREWSRDRAQKPSYRIVIAGYYDEHKELLSEGWGVYKWSTGGGYANVGNGQGRKNAEKEALFYSPHCLPLVKEQGELF